MDDTCEVPTPNAEEMIWKTKETPKIKKKKFSLLCILFDHKYVNIKVEPGIFEATCKRCGKERDVHEPTKKQKYCKECGSPLSVSGLCLNRKCPVDTVEQIAKKVNKSKKTVKKPVKK